MPLNMYLNSDTKVEYLVLELFGLFSFLMLVTPLYLLHIKKKLFVWDARTYLSYYFIFQVYLNFVNYIVNFAFPILTLAVLNYQIYKELRKNLRHEVLLGRRHQNEQKKNALRKRDIRLTRISIIIVVIFMVCQIPRFIMNIIEMVYGDLSKVRYTPRISENLKLKVS